MNHSTKLKNFNRTNAHSKLMFAGMVDAFKTNGHITTTVSKGKALKNILQRDLSDVIYTVRVGRRKGDNAEMMRLVSAAYVEKKFPAQKTEKKIAKQTETDKTKTSKTSK